MIETIRNICYMARRFKAATALNFVGLLVAFVAFYFVRTQVIYYQTYNQSFPDADRLYRVEYIDTEGKWSPYMNRPGSEITEKLPLVEDYAIVPADWDGGQRMQFVKDQTEITCSVNRISPQGLRMLARVMSGRIDWTDDNNSGVVLNASIAQTFFGTTDAVGKALRTQWGWEGTVRAVIEDFPDNSFMVNGVWMSMGHENEGDESNYNYNCIVKLRPDADPTTFEKAYQQANMNEWLEWKKWREGQGAAVSKTDEAQAKESIVSTRYRLTPLSQTYFSGVDTNRDRGNKAMLTVLQLICLLAIVVATINFLNFTLAESPMRIRSVNTRRVLGSTQRQLRLGLIAEAVLTSLLACLLALALCHALSLTPTIGQFLLGPVRLAHHLPTVSLTILLSLLVGFLASVYPAIYATSFAPALVLKSSFGLSPKGRRLRSALVCLQLVVSLVMTIYLGVLLLQSHYIFRSDYGYQKDQLLTLHTGSGEIWNKRPALQAEIAKLPSVANVSYSQFLIGTADTYMGWGRSDKNHRANFVCLPVDWRYLRTLGIDILEGRDFNEHDLNGRAYIINEAARKAWDWVQLDQPLFDGDTTLVVGVCKNFRLGTVKTDNAHTPAVFWLRTYPANDGWDNLGQINIRLTPGADMQHARQQILSIMKQLGKPDATVQPLNLQLQTTYKDELFFVRQVLVFSLFCLLITLVGVFCLTMFETAYRRKEIGIRKVFGATTREVLHLISRQYILLIAIAFLIAAPVAYHLSHSWLQNFAEHTPLHWWLFPLALLLVTTIMMTTVVWQSWKTATANAVESVYNN